MTEQFGELIEPRTRRPVAWYSPSVLLQAGRELLSSMDFQRNLDRRETFTGPVHVIDLSDRSATSAQPFWFDFISDSGDSGNATYAVARAALESSLQVTNSDTALPTGELLILGGDLAYPGASPEEYQYRFLELYEKAKQAARVDTSKKIVAAIPQNHDWFDSLSTFCRYFVNRNNGDFIGAQTPQKQTYFALKLPHNWWVLGFDFALGGDIDRNQFEAFRALLGTPPSATKPDEAAPKPLTEDTPRIAADAQLILIYPEPYWYRTLGDAAPQGYPKRYQRLEHLLESHGARIAMRLAGDQHHYARDTLDTDPATGSPSHLITCGCGGAFMHPTHCRDAAGSKIIDRAQDKNAIGTQNNSGQIDLELQNRIRVGRGKNSPEQPRTVFDAKARYPGSVKSRVLALGNIYAMFRPNFSRPLTALRPGSFFAQIWNSNFGFALCLGLLYGFNAYVNPLFSWESTRPDKFKLMADTVFCEGLRNWLLAMVFAPTALIINLLMLVGCLRIAWEGPVSWWEKLLSGVLHGLVHAFCVFALYWHATHYAAKLSAESPFYASFVVWLLVTGGGVFVGGLLFGCYFALASLLGQMPNNAFSALAMQNYKGFLRFRLVDQQLCAYFVALERVDPQTRWTTPPTHWRVHDKFNV